MWKETRPFQHLKDKPLLERIFLAKNISYVNILG